MTYGTACKTWGIWYFEVERGGLFFASVEGTALDGQKRRGEYWKAAKKIPNIFLCLSGMLVE